MLQYLIAVSLQLGGIILTGLALTTGFLHGNLHMELYILLLAIVVFTLGWALQPEE